MTGKYIPLENFLRDLPESQTEITIGFKQIEKIINAQLPSSAYEDQRWWTREKEGNHVNLRAWTNAGWRIENVEVNKKLARLVRA
jgi:hypothetical protein